MIKKMNKGFKFKLKLTKEQSELIDKSIELNRRAYNYFLEKYIKAYNKYKEGIKAKDKKIISLYKEETKISIKDVKAISNKYGLFYDSVSISNTKMHLNTAFANMKKLGSKFPRFKKYVNYGSYTTSVSKNIIAIKDNKYYIKIPKIKSQISIHVTREFPKGSKIKSITISKTSTGKYYGSILVEYMADIPNAVNTGKELVIASSLENLYVTSEGELGKGQTEYKKSIPVINKKYENMKKKNIKSSGRDKSRKNLSRVYEKITNERINYFHHVSKRLASEYDSIVIINDIIKNTSMDDKSKDYNMKKYQNSFYKLIVMITYKMKDLGKKVVVINDNFDNTFNCEECPNKGVNCSCNKFVEFEKDIVLNYKQHLKK